MYNDGWHFVKDGELSLGVLNFACVIMLAICLAAMAIKQIADKRNEEKE